jgi:hypothetical protein
MILRLALWPVPAHDGGVSEKPPIEARGFKYLLNVMPLLEKLHDCGTQRDSAGNRTLFYDQYVSLMLVAMFSPSIDAMRAICRASDLKNVQKKLGVESVNVATLFLVSG